MTAFIIILTILLLGVVIVQIGKVNELASKIKGEAETEEIDNRAQGRYLMVFMIGFLAFTVISAYMYKNWMLGYGPHESASAHGGLLDSLFNTTLFFTGIIFVLTHIALFYFSWKYKKQKGNKAVYWSHNNMLEIVWSIIPAVVMTFLVVEGLIAWNAVMADVEPNEDVIEIEATGYQFAWHLRYPGPDGLLGEKYYTRINGLNPLGQNWEDKKNLDDLHPSEIVLPVGKKVRVRINARDVLHNFYLPHFRVKMDAVPGIPTYFVFTPTKTTEDYRLGLSEYEEYNEPYDETDPEGPKLWEAFNYELACAELCGASHFSMQRTVRIVSEEEYQDWLSNQSSYYFGSIRGTDDDPYIDILLDQEISARRTEFNTLLESALNSTAVDAEAMGKTLKLTNVQFETGSASLTKLSTYELENLSAAMQKYPNLVIQVAGHTDNTGDADANVLLSQQRADAVKDYVMNKGISESRIQAVGYGQTKPIEDNETDAGRKANRRTEFTIISQ